MNLTVGGANRYYVVINRLYLSVKLSLRKNSFSEVKIFKQTSNVFPIIYFSFIMFSFVFSITLFLFFVNMMRYFCAVKVCSLTQIGLRRLYFIKVEQQSDEICIFFMQRYKT